MRSNVTLVFCLISTLFSFQLEAQIVDKLFGGKKKLFTQEHRNRIEESNPKNIERVQFYVNKKIVLYRETPTRDDEITSSGKVKFEDGLYKYKISIKKNTKCVADAGNNEVLRVFCGASDNYLLFKKIGSPGYYELVGMDYSNSSKTSLYNGEVYKQVEGSDARLKFKDNMKFRTKTENRTEEGREINGE